MKNLNQKGFTAIEIMIGIGLVAMLTLIIVSTQVFLAKDRMNLQNKLEESIDTNLAERILFRDFNGLEPSYNNLILRDDHGNNFFDYYPDVPVSALSKRADRELTLKLSGKIKEFVVFVHDQKAGPMINYDPVAAYDVGPAPADFNQSATLRFKGLNKNKWVSKLYSANSNFWTAGRVLMLDTPARLRPLNSSGNVDMATPPRSPLFVGVISGDSLSVNTSLSSFVNTTNPLTGGKITSVDAFLRQVPSVGGGQSVVRLRPIKAVKYYLKVQRDSTYQGTPAYLYRATFENGKWGDEVMLADKVAEFKITRDSVLKRMLYFKVVKAKKKGS